MAFKKSDNYFVIRVFLLIFFGLLLRISASIDCNGKAFHCVNSTHFMICVDFGGGVSTTVDDFTIPCPPTTICQKSNYFECEFPAPTTPELMLASSDVTNEIGSISSTSKSTISWDEIGVTTILPSTKTSDVTISETYFNTISTSTLFEVSAPVELTTEAIVVEPEKSIESNNSVDLNVKSLDLNLTNNKNESDLLLSNNIVDLTQTTTENIREPTLDNNYFSTSEMPVIDQSIIDIIGNKSTHMKIDNETNLSMKREESVITLTTTSILNDIIVSTETTIMDKNNLESFNSDISVTSTEPNLEFSLNTMDNSIQPETGDKQITINNGDTSTTSAIFVTTGSPTTEFMVYGTNKLNKIDIDAVASLNPSADNSSAILNRTSVDVSPVLEAVPGRENELALNVDYKTTTQDDLITTEISFKVTDANVQTTTSRYTFGSQSNDVGSLNHDKMTPEQKIHNQDSESITVTIERQTNMSQNEIETTTSISTKNSINSGGQDIYFSTLDDNITSLNKITLIPPESTVADKLSTILDPSEHKTSESITIIDINKNSSKGTDQTNRYVLKNSGTNNYEAVLSSTTDINKNEEFVTTTTTQVSEAPESSTMSLNQDLETLETVIPTHVTSLLATTTTTNVATALPSVIENADDHVTLHTVVTAADINSIENSLSTSAPKEENAFENSVTNNYGNDPISTKYTKKVKELFSSTPTEDYESTILSTVLLTTITPNLVTNFSYIETDQNPVENYVTNIYAPEINVNKNEEFVMSTASEVSEATESNTFTLTQKLGTLESEVNTYDTLSVTTTTSSAATDFPFTALIDNDHITLGTVTAVHINQNENSSEKSLQKDRNVITHFDTNIFEKDSTFVTNINNNEEFVKSTATEASESKDSYIPQNLDTFTSGVITYDPLSSTIPTTPNGVTDFPSIDFNDNYNIISINQNENGTEESDQTDRNENSVTNTYISVSSPVTHVTKNNEIVVNNVTDTTETTESGTSFFNQLGTLSSEALSHNNSSVATIPNEYSYVTSSQYNISTILETDTTFNYLQNKLLNNTAPTAKSIMANTLDLLHNTSFISLEQELFNGSNNYKKSTITLTLNATASRNPLQNELLGSSAQIAGSTTANSLEDVYKPKQFDANNFEPNDESITTTLHEITSKPLNNAMFSRPTQESVTTTILNIDDISKINLNNVHIPLQSFESTTRTVLERNSSNSLDNIYEDNKENQLLVLTTIKSDTPFLDTIELFNDKAQSEDSTTTTSLNTDDLLMINSTEMEVPTSTATLEVENSHNILKHSLLNNSAQAVKYTTKSSNVQNTDSLQNVLINQLDFNSQDVYRPTETEKILETTTEVVGKTSTKGNVLLINQELTQDSVTTTMLNVQKIYHNPSENEKSTAATISTSSLSQNVENVLLTTGTEVTIKPTRDILDIEITANNVDLYTIVNAPTKHHEEEIATSKLKTTAMEDNIYHKNSKNNNSIHDIPQRHTTKTLGKLESQNAPDTEAQTEAIFLSSSDSLQSIVSNKEDQPMQTLTSTNKITELLNVALGVREEKILHNIINVTPNSFNFMDVENFTNTEIPVSKGETVKPGVDFDVGTYIHENSNASNIDFSNGSITSFINKESVVTTPSLRNSVNINNAVMNTPSNNGNLLSNDRQRISHVRNISATDNKTYDDTISKPDSTLLQTDRTLTSVSYTRTPDRKQSIIETFTTHSTTTNDKETKVQDESTITHKTENRTSNTNDNYTNIQALQTSTSNNKNIVYGHENHSSHTFASFDCQHRSRGKYADKDDCRKFFICIGRHQPIVGACPVNTVFSDIKKQCTKNLSHCIRNNQFQCAAEGRFTDLALENIYYICVNNKAGSFVRFRFQCQNGYHLNKETVSCVLNSEPLNQSIISNSNSKNDSDKTSDTAYQEDRSSSKENNFECVKEGKFADPTDCRKYFVCKKSKNSSFRRKKRKCDRDEVFHNDKKKCVDSESYECVSN